MDPLDWTYMYRPNRPFHFITNRKLRGSIPKLPPRPWLERRPKPVGPSAYLREQMAFMTAIPPPIPEYHVSDDDAPPAGPLKVWCLFVWAILVKIGWLLFIALSMGAQVLKKIGVAALRTYQKVGGFPWEALWIALAASQLIRFLPGMEGQVGLVKEVCQRDPPLYVLMIRNPNQWCKYFSFSGRVNWN